ncbi:hypothetical protein M233_09275 [Xylella fastidiosa subsp. multiplex Griffin-1]|nr:hypothetical protein M233_09275 [Xylella fastidiosa subsp. multiplex Griffin-1]
MTVLGDVFVLGVGVVVERCLSKGISAHQRVHGRSV